METLRSQDAQSTRALVQQYLQNAESIGTGAEERSHLAQLCTECILLFRIILKSMDAQNESSSNQWKLLGVSLRRSYGRLKIWSEEHGATDGSLDATLGASWDLQRDTVKYIVSISQTLTERLIKYLDVSLDVTGVESISTVRSLTAAVTEGNSDNSSDSGLSDSSSDTVGGILEDLRVDTTCLLDLEPLLCSPILQTDPEPTATVDSAHLTWRPYHSYCDKVSARFPKAADDLVNRVGKANYERYLRCQEQKAKNESGDVALDQRATSALDNASSKFHDSGIGSSLHNTASLYAETVMSYGLGEGRRVRVPPLPAQAKQGVPFECVACGKLLKITTNSAWKKHVYVDLQPWICIEADCHLGTDTFPTRNDWVTHLALDHGMDPDWRNIECPLCRAEIGPGKHSVTGHMSHHLEEVSLSALPADCEFEEEFEGSEPDPEDDHVESIKMEQMDALNTSPVTASGNATFPNTYVQVMDTLRRPRSKFELPNGTKDESHPMEDSRQYEECPLCGQRFRGIAKNRKQNLNRHIKSKHGNVRFCCPHPGCRRSYNRVDNFRDHERKVHGLVPSLQETDGDGASGPSYITAGDGHRVPVIPVQSTSSLPNLDQSFMRDFRCCDRYFHTLNNLQRHYEESHNHHGYSDLSGLGLGRPDHYTPEEWDTLMAGVSGGAHDLKRPEPQTMRDFTQHAVLRDDDTSLTDYQEWDEMLKTANNHQRDPPTLDDQPLLSTLYEHDQGRRSRSRSRSRSLARRSRSRSRSRSLARRSRSRSRSHSLASRVNDPDPGMSFPPQAPHSPPQYPHVFPKVLPAPRRTSPIPFPEESPTPQRDQYRQRKTELRGAVSAAQNAPVAGSDFKVHTGKELDSSLAQQQDEALQLTNGHVNGAHAKRVNGNFVDGYSGLIDDDIEEEADDELTHSRGGVSMSKPNASNRARKHRREYPSSWGFDKGQMTMKKRVMAVFDGPRRVPGNDKMPPTERVESAADGKSYVTDLDIQTMKRAEGFLNATEEEKGIWITDDPTEEDIKAMLDAQVQ